jgi:hypothetical protein
LLPGLRVSTPGRIKRHAESLDPGAKAPRGQQERIGCFGSQIAFDLGNFDHGIGGDTMPARQPPPGGQVLYRKKSDVGEARFGRLRAESNPTGSARSHGSAVGRQGNLFTPERFGIGPIRTARDDTAGRLNREPKLCERSALR